MPTLDEYRRALVVRLEACAEVEQARMLLAEADLWLTVSQISEPGRAAFWQSVSRELASYSNEVAMLRVRLLESLLEGILADPGSSSFTKVPA